MKYSSIHAEEGARGKWSQPPIDPKILTFSLVSTLPTTSAKSCQHGIHGFWEYPGLWNNGSERCGKADQCTDESGSVQLLAVKQLSSPCCSHSCRVEEFQASLVWKACLKEQKQACSLVLGSFILLLLGAVVTSSVSCKVMINHLTQFGLIVLIKVVGTAVRTQHTTLLYILHSYLWRVEKTQKSPFNSTSVHPCSHIWQGLASKTFSWPLILRTVEQEHWDRPWAHWAHSHEWTACRK